VVAEERPDAHEVAVGALVGSRGVIEGEHAVEVVAAGADLLQVLQVDEALVVIPVIGGQPVEGAAGGGEDERRGLVREQEVAQDPADVLLAAGRPHGGLEQRRGEAPAQEVVDVRALHHRERADVKVDPLGRRVDLRVGGADEGLVDVEDEQGGHVDRPLWIS
jgi:hypothetical protein